MPADTETLEAQSAAKGTYSPSDDLMSALNAIPGRDDPNPDSPMAQTEPEAKAPTPDPEPDPKTEPAPEPAKPDPVKEPSAEDDPLGLSKFKKKPDEPKKAEPAKQEPSKKPEAQQTPKELRAAYEKLKGEVEAERQAKAALQTKLDEALNRPVPEELEKKWKGDLDAASKRASELEESLKLTNFEKSPTYTKEFIEPLTNAWEQAHEELVDQEVTVNGETRKTTPEDLHAVVASPTLIQASRKARELFGDDAGAAMSASAPLEPFDSLMRSWTGMMLAPQKLMQSFNNGWSFANLTINSMNSSARCKEYRLMSVGRRETDERRDISRRYTNFFRKKTETPRIPGLLPSGQSGWP